MKGKHFHEEWSFRAIFTWRGKVNHTVRFCAADDVIFDTEERARRQMNFLTGRLNAMLQCSGGRAQYGGFCFDAFEIYAPTRRIVTEWEDEGL